jgi:hypothetical protein
MRFGASVIKEKPLMRPYSFFRLICLAAIASFLFSCNEKEEFTTEKLQDYVVLAPGKFITYRLDSMVFTNFGRTTEIHKYQVKYVVDQLITDNLGRPSWRVYRYIRDSVDINSWTPAQPWSNSGTIQLTPLSDQLELIEDNYRFIKLHLPIDDHFSWNGNKYLPTSGCGLSSGPYCPIYQFSNDDDMEDWDFFYDGKGETFSYKGKTYTDVLTVEEADESLNVPITVPTAYAARTRAVEKYSKTIGLVYREYELWEYQPNTGNPAGPYKTGFGITQWMIDHN